MNLRIAMMVCVSLGLLAGSNVQAEIRTQDAPQDALYELDPGPPSPIEGVPGVVSRHRIQLHDIGALYNLLREATERDARPFSQHYTLPLTHDSTARVQLDSPAKGADDNRRLVSGRVVSRQGGRVVLVVTGHTLDGRLTVGRQHFLIRNIGADHFLLALDPGALPPEAPPRLPMPVPLEHPEDDPAHHHATVTCDHHQAKEIRVLVLYTEAARAGAVAAARTILGDPASAAPIDPDLDIGKAVEEALGWANAALAISGARTSFSTTIKARPIDPDFVETGDGGRVLADLYQAGHPLYEGAREHRNEAGANLVALIIEHWEYCGGAPVMIDWNMHPDQTAFSVVRRSCLNVSDKSLGHELAHSMGSAHDQANAIVPGLFRYSYGHNQPKGDVSTMMAYECPGCVREPNFSNPNVNFDADGPAAGYPTGCPASSTDPECPPAYNVRSLDRAACQVVRWQ